MTSDWFQNHKPAAPARVHLVLAAAMWSVVGAALLIVGFRWTFLFPEPTAAWLAGAAVAVGVAKSRFVLDRAARGIAGRIAARGDGRCVGGFLSLRSWILVAVMMVAGRLLRSGIVAARVAGPLYAAIGTALLLSSRLLWHAWQSARASQTLE